MWDHKFINKSGYATFWNCIENAVKYVDDKLKVNVVSNAHECPTLKGKMPVKRAVCSNVRSLQLILFHVLIIFFFSLQCESHLGFVYDDGPHPLGLRYQINSASLNFEKKGWFDIPEFSKSKRKALRKQMEYT